MSRTRGKLTVNTVYLFHLSNERIHTENLKSHFEKEGIERETN